MDQRDEFVHYLGGIPITTMKNGKFGFSIRGLHILGGEISTVESIFDYLKETMASLSEIILLINDKFCSSHRVFTNT